MALPELPSNILDILGPARDAIDREAREATRSVVIPRVVRGAQVAVRINGASYAQAAASIVDAVTGDRRAVTSPVTLASGDPLQAETRLRLGDDAPTIPASWINGDDDDGDGDDGDDDDGECGCDASDCETCHPPCDSTASECCGYCRDCGSHHEDDQDYRRMTCGHCSRCHVCGHDCDR